MTLDESAVSGGESGRSGTQAIERAFTVLGVVCDQTTPLTLSAIVGETGLAKTTVRRILRVLVQQRILSQDPLSKRYSTGIRLFEIANIALSKRDFNAEAMVELRRTCSEINETMHLGVFDAGEVVYINKVDSSRPIRMYSAVGKRAPCHCTGIGKTLLAFGPKSWLEEAVELGLRRFTSTTVVTVDDLLGDLETTRDRGYAFDDGEHETQVRCVASPVRDASGQVVAAISLSMPVTRFSRGDLEDKYAPVVQGCAGRISARLGFVS